LRIYPPAHARTTAAAAQVAAAGARHPPRAGVPGWLFSGRAPSRARDCESWGCSRPACRRNTPKPRARGSGLVFQRARPKSSQRLRGLGVLAAGVSAQHPQTPGPGFWDEFLATRPCIRTRARAPRSMAFGCGHDGAALLTARGTLWRLNSSGPTSEALLLVGPGRADATDGYDPVWDDPDAGAPPPGHRGFWS